MILEQILKRLTLWVAVSFSVAFIYLSISSMGPDGGAIVGAVLLMLGAACGVIHGITWFTLSLLFGRNYPA